MELQYNLNHPIKIFIIDPLITHNPFFYHLNNILNRKEKKKENYEKRKKKLWNRWERLIIPPHENFFMAANNFAAHNIEFPTINLHSFMPLSLMCSCMRYKFSNALLVWGWLVHAVFCQERVEGLKEHLKLLVDRSQFVALLSLRITH